MLVITCRTLAAPAPAPATQPLDLDTAAPADLVEAIVEAIDEGSSASRYIQPATDRGMSAAVACEPFLARDGKPPIDALYEVISGAGKSRRSNRELLRLYDPVAYRIFYTPEGEADQSKLAGGIDANDWPNHFADALVRAAPLPTLKWMKAQAATPSPQFEHLRRIWQQWGWWIRSGNERQYEAEVRQTIALLAGSQAIFADAPTRAALLRFVGEAGALESLDYVIAGLRVIDNGGGTTDADVRNEAATALGRLGVSKRISTKQSNQAMAALAEACAKEPDNAVLAKLAESAEAWSRDARAGEAMLNLFTRSADPAVRRSILFSAADATWPQRSTLLSRALRTDEDGSVRGIALQAVAPHPSKEFVEPTLAILDAVTVPEPALVDAAGALGDGRATPKLIAWLKAERNPSARLKMALALEKIADPPARAALLDLIGREDNAVVMDHLVSIAGRIHLEGTEQTLLALVEDKTAPAAVRVSAIWSLGRFDTPAVREALAKWSAHRNEVFGDPLDPTLPAGQYERVEQANIYLVMSRLRLGDADAAKELRALFDHATPTARLGMLMMLADQKRDEPEIIAQGLASTDFAVLLAAIKAAGTAAPGKYHAQLVAIRDAPFVSALIQSAGLDTMNFKSTLATAIAAGEKEMLKETP